MSRKVEADRVPSRDDIQEEMELYLELRAEELARDEDLDPAAARARAEALFGSVESLVDRCREARHVEMVRKRRWEVMGDLRSDLKFGVRLLRRSPAFTAIAVLTLALGIGATSAMVSIADAVLFKRPAVDDPGSLAAIYTTCRRGFPRCSSSYPDYQDYGQAASLEALAAFTYSRVSVGLDDGAELAWAKPSTGNLFELLGVRPHLGRLLLPRDDDLDSPSRVAVLSHAFWTQSFGADPSVLGRSVDVNGTPFEVVGVTPPEYRGLALDDGVQLWVPLTSLVYIQDGMAERFEDRASRWISNVVGRMSPGTDIERARAELLAVSDRLAEMDPDARGPRTVTVDPVGTYVLPVADREAIVRFVVLFSGVVALALLLTCANLANLLLSRAAARKGEVGVRLALGAGGGRITRQFLTESVLLAALGGMAGLLVSRLVLRLIGQFELPGGVPVSSLGVELDARTFGVIASITLLTGFIFGLAPAVSARRQEASLQLDGGGRGSAAGPLGLRSLVAVQVALCTVLLVGSGLFIRSLRQALAVNPGFRPARLAVAQVDLSLNDYTLEDAERLTSTLRDRVAEYPGVASASWGQRTPLQVGGGRGLFAGVEGYEPAADEEIRIDLNVIGAGHLATLGRTMVSGREFTPSDDALATPVAVVNRTMAERYWPDGNAVGGRIALGGGNQFLEGERVFEVVGVVENVKWRTLDEESTNFVSLAFGQAPEELAENPASLAIRTTGNAPGLLEFVRTELRRLDPNVPLLSLGEAEDGVARVLMPQRMGAALLTAFGILALILAAVGVAGVAGYAVTRRTREVGIRMALGASAGGVMGLVSRQMLVPVGAGLLVGIFVAAALFQAAETFLFGVPATDPTTFLLAASVLAVVVGGATLVPAVRAARIDPLEALRYQ